MNNSPSNRCGYTWPTNHTVDDNVDQQSCCYRETLPDTNFCAWHADPDETDFKTIEHLQKARSQFEDYNENRSESKDPRELIKESSQELLDGADLRGLILEDNISFKSVSLRDSDFSDANLNGANFRSADLRGSNLTDIALRDADLTGAVLSKADFTDAALSRANLTGAVLYETNLTEASLLEATLSDVLLFGRADFTGVNLVGADLIDANLDGADFTGANLDDADLTDATLVRATLTNATLSMANLTRSNLEKALLMRANLFGTDLTDCKLHGTTLTDAQINGQTIFESKQKRAENSRWWQKGLLFPPPRCGYDPINQDTDDMVEEERIDLISKAADTYQTLEHVARENAQPSIQSLMFLRRQDMQRKRYWQQKEYVKYGFARISRAIFKHGESLARIFAWAVLIILSYAAVYTRFNLITDASGEFINAPVDALYFSTLTFTTLGLGDFQPSPASQFARLLVTSQAALGAILIAIFVFVLGRRAAR
jgi:uncharacterized protein YjbI with pentapeptide repeats